MSCNQFLYIVPQADFTGFITTKNQVVHKIETSQNFKGLHAASLGDEFSVAVPAQDEGYVSITWFRHQLTSSLKSSGSENSDVVPICVIGKSKIKVNESGVAVLALNSTGTVLAVASTKVSKFHGNIF